MDKQELMICVYRLSVKWKDHFGLYTQYVGYLTAELVITLLYVWRTTNPLDFDGLTGEEIRLLIDNRATSINEQEGLKLTLFPLDNDIDTVMPKLIEILNEYDLSENNLPNEDWQEFIDYLSSKISR